MEMWTPKRLIYQCYCSVFSYFQLQGRISISVHFKFHTFRKKPSHQTLYFQLFHDNTSFYLGQPADTFWPFKWKCQCRLLILAVTWSILSHLLLPGLYLQITAGRSAAAREVSVPVWLTLPSQVGAGCLETLQEGHFALALDNDELNW